MGRDVFAGVLLAGSLAFAATASGDAVSPERAREAADLFLRTRQSRAVSESRAVSVMATAGTAVSDEVREVRGDDGTILAYVARLNPRGFVVTSAHTDTPPIVAYSFQSLFPEGVDDGHPLRQLVKADMMLRLRALAQGQLAAAPANEMLWGRYSSGAQEGLGDTTFQQWPQAESTSTGGWLETAWHQDAPYYDFCPLDPVDGQRSYVGYVATAMAQLLNYHRQANATFDVWDSYTASNGIDVDADSERYDFPSFQELNEHLTEVQRKFAAQVELDDADVAALSFASGVSVGMDYSSEGSGASPYAMQQALLSKFGFDSARIVGGLSVEFVPVLQENLANRLPVLLGMSPADGFGGHAVVCDGYNTDGQYHLNFGWGTPYPAEITEVWYHLPVDLPAYLSAVPEIVLDIRPTPLSLAVNPNPIRFYHLWGQPDEIKTLVLRNNSSAELPIVGITTPPGFQISLAGDEYSDHIDRFEISQVEEEVVLNVRFTPEGAGSYYGTLDIGYGDGSRRQVVLTGTSVVGGTEVEPGVVSGSWLAAKSPYYVLGDVNVPAGEELTIEPGVQVLFMGPYHLTVRRNARLAAEGTPVQPIELTAGNKQTGWKGLRFIDTGSDDILRHCSISYAKKGAGQMSLWGRGSNSPETSGRSLYCSSSSPTISHCKLTNNIGDRGGAVYSVDSNLVISNTLIANNASLGRDPQGAGICSEGDGAVRISSCTIVNNAPGGVFGASFYGTEVANSILWGNSGYQIQSHESVATVSFSDIQDGFAGDGNLDADPCFFDPSAGAGADHDASAANWTLQSSSPCINAGIDRDLTENDLAGQTRVFSQRVDLGAFENQSNLPLLTLVPAGSLDFGTVYVGSGGTMTFEITNTGTFDFEIESLSLSDPSAVFSIQTPAAAQLLSPGASVEVGISFAPIREMAYSGVLHVFSTSSNAPHQRIALHGIGVSGTLVPAGEVQGRWTQGESPYFVTGDIEVARDRELTIEPGVTVKFAGHYSLTVGYRATLMAAGTEPEPILFTAIDIEEGWSGLRFVHAGDDDVLQYCTIEYGIKRFSDGARMVDLLGGGILCCGGDSLWRFIPSSPTIDHCVISNNHGAYGGGHRMYGRIRGRDTSLLDRR